MTRFTDQEVHVLHKIINAIEFHSVPGHFKINTTFHLVYDYQESSIMESIKGKLSRRPVHCLDLDTWESFPDYDFTE